MLKAEKASQFGSDSRLTKVQELKQVGFKLLKFGSTFCFSIFNFHFMLTEFFELRLTTILPLQHMAGVSLVDKVTSALLGADNDDTSNIILDLIGYDGWPAIYAMMQVSSGLFSKL